MNWTFFPKNKKLPSKLKAITEAFTDCNDIISSSEHMLKSNDVLAKLRPKFEALGFKVEKGKAETDKIKVPVMYGENGRIELFFEADAYDFENNIIIEIEAGRAVTNYQFLKDFYEACCMVDSEYLCIAVREIYRGNKDYQKVCSFFDSMYISNRFNIPLKGILIIGY